MSQKFRARGRPAGETHRSRIPKTLPRFSDGVNNRLDELTNKVHINPCELDSNATDKPLTAEQFSRLLLQVTFVLCGYILEMLMFTNGAKDVHSLRMNNTAITWAIRHRYCHLNGNESRICFNLVMDGDDDVITRHYLPIAILILTNVTSCPDTKQDTTVGPDGVLT